MAVRPGRQPGLGLDVQQVVTEQIPCDYEVYVGILCTRVGTPTPRALSGTVEEFEDARRRWLATGSPRILSTSASRRGRRPARRTPTGSRRSGTSDGATRAFSPSTRASASWRCCSRRDLIREVLALGFPEPSAEVPLGPRARPRVAPGVRPRDRPCACLPAFSLPRLVVAAAGAVLAKLEAVFDLGRVLTPEEQEVLAAASYARVLRFRAGRPGPEGVEPPPL